MPKKAEQCGAKSRADDVGPGALPLRAGPGEWSARERCGSGAPLLLLAVLAGRRVLPARR